MPTRRLWLAPLLLAPCIALGQGGALVKTDEVQAQLVADAPEGIAPGKPLQLGLLIRHAPQWHTYWKNPGDSGLPTTLNWTLPAGVSAGAIEWPTPTRLPVGPLINYGYEGTVLLPVPVSVAPQFSTTELDVQLRADWLVCKEVCIPQSGEFRLRLPAAAATVADAEHFRAARARVPRVWPAVTVQSSVDAQTLALDVRALPPQWQGKAVEFFAADAGVINHAGAVEQRWAADSLALRVPLSAQRSESPTTMEAVLTVPGQVQGVALRFAVGGWLPPAPAPAHAGLRSAPVAAGPGFVWWASLAFAFVGGLLLNLMPCVFPVLSLKVLGFAQHREHRGQRIAGGLAYTLGVVLSFVALAALMLALRTAGDGLGWGFQLQSPLFVAALAVLFTLIGLNLLGAFELTRVLPSGLVALRSRHPIVDHGLTGALAVAVASPCTAPFMGAALGAALTMPNAQALAVFVALGLGMAAPYLAACLWPGLSRVLPRPGAWMRRFKVVLALPMFATVAWLLWVLGQQLGTGTVGNEPASAQQTWQRWSPEALARVRAEGRPVLVDFTAAWCVTCQVNKRLVLNDEGLGAEIRAKQVELMRADWTRHDPAITEALRQLGRSGVPVYALYAPASREPQLLSEILTVSEVRDAMAQWPDRIPAREPEAAQPRLP